MKPVYIAAHALEAAIVRNLLTDAGIGVQVLGEYLGGGAGELPLTEACPRLYLENPRDWDRARELLRAYETGHDSAQHWRCRRCGETSPNNFALCWNCGTPQAE